MKVEDMKRRQAMTYARPGYSAKLVALGLELRVSRYDSEPAGQWVVDGQWRQGQVWPAYWNGEGSRCTLLKAISDPEAIRLLDEAAQAVA